MNVRRALGEGALIAGLLVLAGTSARAKNSRMINIAYPATLNGAQVPAGDYEVTWQAQIPKAIVTLSDTRRVVVSKTGHWESRSRMYDRNSVVYDATAEGTPIILEIRFAGMKGALVFGPES